mmetsp:Transcript_21228/g.33550  ORF Transcript_21228/g.33550 Transcript_21228/m.33550 type:complete len:205 (-) Transcript_21228:807-1421(-)
MQWPALPFFFLLLHISLRGRRRYHLLLLRGVEHAVGHQSLLECAVHLLHAVAVLQCLPPEVGAPHHEPGAECALIDCVPPAGDGLVGPVGRTDLLHLAGALDELDVILDRNKVRVRPFGVKKVQRLLLLRGERHGGVVPLAPGGHYKASPGLQHAHHLLDVLLLVGHVLARLAGPHKVEAIVWEAHLQGIHQLELRVGHALLHS